MATCVYRQTKPQLGTTASGEVSDDITHVHAALPYGALCSRCWWWQARRQCDQRVLCLETAEGWAFAGSPCCCGSCVIKPAASVYSHITMNPGHAIYSLDRCSTVSATSAKALQVHA